MPRDVPGIKLVRVSLGMDVNGLAMSRTMGEPRRLGLMLLVHLS